MAAMSIINCLNCGEERSVRTADKVRGWGLFCNKSCKQTYQLAVRRTKKEQPAPKIAVKTNKVVKSAAVSRFERSMYWDAMESGDPTHVEHK